jgi:hypothetical protein
VGALLDRVSRRAPLVAEGKSGAFLEHGVLVDGTAVVLKHVDPARDWIMQATGDDGRVARLWADGQLARLPARIDHAVLAVEAEDGHTVVVMRDVSAALFDDSRPDPAAHRLVLDAVAELHREFRDDEVITGLCSLSRRYALLSPQVCAGLAGNHLVPRLVIEGWERFADLAPPDVVEAVDAIHADPSVFAARLAARPSTLLHGDLKQANLGVRGERVVVLDWGTLSGWGPPAVDFAFYIAINAAWLGLPHDEILDDVRAAAGPDHDEAALRLALLGALAQLGWEKALGATADDEATRARERGGLSWWVARTRDALGLLDG